MLFLSSSSKRFSTGVALVVTVLLLVGHSAWATTIVSINLSGIINGAPVTATGSGTIDMGTSVSSLHVDWAKSQAVPPLTLATAAWGVSAGCAGVTQGAALNLQKLTGGNYTLTRHITWPSVPGSAIDVVGSVSTTGNQMAITGTVSGSYNGPTDVVDMTNWTQNWTRSGNGTAIDYTASAVAHRADGGTFLVQYSGIYGAGGPLLPGPEVLSVNLMSFSSTATTEDFTWSNTVSMVPEPDLLSSIRTAVEFRFNAATGVSYRIEASADLIKWDIIEPVITGQSAVVTRFYSTENMPNRYFRVSRN